MTVGRITIREAVPGDIETLLAFNLAMARETEGKALDPDAARQGVGAVFRAPEKGFYLVAEGECQVIGGLLVTYEWSDWRNATFWWVQSVYVEPAWRRRGVYRAMHDRVLERARTRGGVCGVRLYVDRGNAVAQQTYQGLGMAKSHYDMYEIDLVP